MPISFLPDFNHFLDWLNSPNTKELMENLPSFKSPDEPSILNSKELARYIDHTLLDPKATAKDIERLGKETVEHEFKSACIAPNYVFQMTKLLRGSRSLVCTVLNFPLGQSTTQSILKEAEVALRNGANELDLVMPIGTFRSKDYQSVYDLISAISHLGAPLKVILETAYLNENEIIVASKLAEFSGAQFIKTSTGFALQEPKGAVPKHIQLLRSILNPGTKIKASGGIRTRDSALHFLACGADRLGTSNGVQMMNEHKTTPQQTGNY